MENPEPLLTIAEVAVAFAGFASLVTVVAQRGLASWTEGNVLRFRLMIYMSLSSILFALLPFVFLAFEALRESAWSMSSLLLALYLGAYFLMSTPANVRLVRRGQLNPYVVVSLSAIVFGTTALQACAAVGLVRPSLGVYFVGVLCLLLLSGVSFARLIAMAILPSR